MKFPLAWYLTWTTYGTWLHGDSRGSHIGRRFQPPDATLVAAMRAEMTEDPVYLSGSQRDLVDRTLMAECAAQGWIVHARNVRTNHAHIVVSANTDGVAVRRRLKALASDALSTDANLPPAGKNGRRRWWTEKGNVVPVETDQALKGVVIYVSELQ